ncbi:hypothetical protein PDIG_35290 [Penicillium digitatum PHI26]|uniref:Uncharacterized protein n=2 Tax=Penicillium digitatum TaxID=36651 RepID=K9GLI2_PEND2|nr:hypothetical protein PDIP_54840 [Penicillium digitatum Pd1]EKV11850.1 hypothetical protein PDIP_54840 [Penicillium digitatum Pd1]EKV14046.1 hypothetical protein PDIG_35290 [Penicillium digitatum PHI26]
MKAKTSDSYTAVQQKMINLISTSRRHVEDRITTDGQEKDIR